MSSAADIRFLVVDDFETMRRIIRALLKEIGYHNVEEAADGVAALDTLRKVNCDFVVTDINMPNMDGFELLAGIRKDEALSHLPVLMVTAEARRDDILRAAREGAAGYIVKPFTRATLEEKVTRILQRVGATA